MGDARSISLIAIHTHDIPQAFPADALERGRDRADATPLGRRTDLRDIPLVTIDGEDARDFDDAVFAEPDAGRASASSSRSPTSPITCAPARRSTTRRARAATASISPTASCRCCRRRCPTAGAACVPTRTAAACSSNSTSTRNGRKTAHRFGRGLMRSAARLTYEGVQHAHDAGDARLRSSVCGVPRPAAPPASRAARSISTCRSAAWCSTTTARCAASRRGRGSTAIG